MATTIRPEISKNREYHIDKHRYYELKHFCLQYKVWKRFLSMDIGYQGISPNERVQGGERISQTEYAAILRERYLRNTDLIEKAAKKAGNDLDGYLLMAVTEGLSYETLRLKHGLPCCREVYYEMYRRFFKVLDELRD